jgi:uncharacterized membrane protein
MNFPIPHKNSITTTTTTKKMATIFCKFFEYASMRTKKRSVHMSKEKNESLSTESIQAKKKALILKQGYKWPMPVIIVAVLAALIAAGLFLGGFTETQTQPTLAAAAPVPTAQSGANSVSYPVASFADGKAKFFSYTTDDKADVQYFIIKSSDGVIRAAFNACDVCWQAGKGYTQSGDYMVCGNCGRRFISTQINEVRGGCNPAPLKRTIAGDQVQIAVADILDGKKYFML